MKENREFKVEFVSYAPIGKIAKIRITDFNGEFTEHWVSSYDTITVNLEATNLTEINEILDKIQHKLINKTMNPLEFAYNAIGAVIIGSMIFWAIMWYFVL